MTAQLIGDREKLRDAEQRIRDIYVALADYLTDRDDYDIPYAVLRAGCPTSVPEAVQDSCFTGLLQGVVRRGPDRSRPLPHEAEVDLDYMTGARRAPVNDEAAPAGTETAPDHPKETTS